MLEAAASALWTPPAPLWGTGLLCLGHMGTLKKQQGYAQGFVPACQQPISTDAAACFRLMPQHLLSSSPWEGRTDKPSSIFTRGKWELLTAALGEAVWISVGVTGVGGEGDAGLLCSSISGHAMEQESLPWASEQVSSSSSRNTRGVGASPSAPGITVSFPVLAAKGMGNTSAYRTLLGHNSLHDLIILIGINWENNSLFQQE